MKKILHYIHTRLFNRITVKKLLKLGFIPNPDEDGSFILGEYEIPNKEGVKSPKFVIYPATGDLLYLTNVAFNGLKSIRTLQSIMEWDLQYQKSKKK